MSLKYPEKVFARMLSVKDKEEIFLIRKDTLIQFGNSSKILGTAIMTNPGSFGFRESKEWEAFKMGHTSYNVFEAFDKPDLTMQNIIKVIRDSYKSLGVSGPDGVVRVYNLSNVVESKKDNLEAKHRRILQVLQSNTSFDSKCLIDPLINDEYEFVKTCNEGDFFIMGFADNIFPSQVSKLKAWSENPVLRDKLVCAIDKSGRMSHPRRWRTEGYLMNKAIERLIEVLNKREALNNNQKGYTILRWNEQYGSEAKFIVRENGQNLQSVYIPGRVQDLVWTSTDLANSPELKDWSTFGNETVDDLESVAM